jgi:uncharacterized protein (TIGR02231 family)
MKKFLLVVSAALILQLNVYSDDDAEADPSADESSIESAISSVRLYQNQAKVERSVKIKLKKGNNALVFGGLPGGLHDWSVRGSLPKDYSGKIVSIEVEKRALVQKRQKKILDLENKLKNLRDKDQVFLDELQEIHSQEKFIASISEFTHQTASKELQTRIPQIDVWDSTLNYTSRKTKTLQARKREIEKEREELGKEIQKWEFELSQIAGTNYYSTYQQLNKKAIQSRSNLEIQQYSDSNVQYGERKRLLGAAEGKIDIEKRVITNIHSSRDGETEFTFSYVMPDTRWQMLYDFRASRENSTIDIVVYANIYQKTGEDWNNINLLLSTGSPVTSIKPPAVPSWYLDIYQPRPANGGGRSYAKKAEAPSSKQKLGAMMLDKMDYYAEQEADEEPYAPPAVSDAGPYFEITMPIRQSIPSSVKYQKKLIQEYSLPGLSDMSFYYQLVPAEQRESVLMIKASNSTTLPWMEGEAQIFLENEYTGKFTMPYTPIGKDEKIAVNVESRINGAKELIKKFEDTSGVFGGNRRILYKYKITVENRHPKKNEILVLDNIPVSKNEKIKVEVENLSNKYFEDAEFKKSMDYGRGVRRWKIELEPNKKTEITYDIVVTFDKEITVNGLK